MRYFSRHEVLCLLSGVFMDHRGSGRLPTMQWLKSNKELPLPNFLLHPFGWISRLLVDTSFSAFKSKSCLLCSCLFMGRALADPPAETVP